MPLLELVKIKKRFGGLVAVDSVDLSVEKGELRGLIGPNGSGKTTLLNLISGFIHPTDGHILWRGHDITRLPAEKRARKGIVRTFQLTTLFKEMTVLQNVVIGGYPNSKWNFLKEMFTSIEKGQDQQKLEEQSLGLLEVMGLTNFKNELAGSLPHGYQRRLGIAVALAAEPELLLLDEPVTGMTGVEKKETMEKVQALRDRGVTIILVEHDMKTIMGYCNNITVINFGKKIAQGTPAEITNNPGVVEAYLGREETYVGT